ncbi:MAG: TonB-dependent receptor [Lewinellaceae bacterium]|nr:TonB-dependent receptor [Lewinellaceae bacterium]MCB9290781.1 TonB-dependent receptor [Lewinellaceae bacterium]
MKLTTKQNIRLPDGCRLALYALVLQLLMATNLAAHINATAVASEDNLLQSEAKTITGKVTAPDSPEGLPGVNVIVKGTSMGTVTDVNGIFSIDVPSEESVLVFKFIGYRTVEITVGSQSVINVVLAQDAQALDEVVVVGYGYVKKSDLTGSVTQVGAEKVSEFPTFEVSQALKGRAAGVQVSQNSGRPGGRIQVRVRGNNSMIGSNEPLYVVDGYPITGDISFLNPSDIASIDILKDASATAIYGSRGANGVVIVTTKRGSQNQAGRISVETYFGAQEVIGRFDLLKAPEYAVLVNDFLENNGQTPFFTSIPTEPGTDWQDVIFRTARLQNHTITFSKGSDKTNYSLSGNFFEQEGVIISTGVQRASVRFNMDSEINDFVKIGTNLNLTRSAVDYQTVDNGHFGQNIYSGAISAPPTLPVYDEDGVPTNLSQIYTFLDPSTRNPMYFANRKDKRVLNTFIGNAYIDFAIARGLSFKTIWGTDFNMRANEGFTPIIYPGERGSASESRSESYSWLNENLLTYKPTLGGSNDLSVVAGFTVQKFTSKDLGIGVNGFSNNTTENYDLGAAETVETPSSGYNEWSLASALGRVNYTLNGKYLFTASIRADGSSRFAPGNKWSYFPSGAFAWRVSDEPFLVGNRVIGNLKLRASYGITGNQGINSYQTLNRLTSTIAVYGNGGEVVGFVPAAIANPDLKWETTEQLDVGFDLGLIGNRYRFTFDYYIKNTKDLLASVPLPPSVGFGSILRNIGAIKNSGVELSLDADVLVGAFQWNAYGQISFNKNEVVSLAGGDDVLGDGLGQPFVAPLNIAREGEPFGMFYGLEEDGLDEEGFIKYVDQNGDEVINTQDRVIIGNPYPDFLFGFGSNFSFKNFDLNIFFEGSQGNDIFFATAGTQLSSFNRGQNQFAELFGNYWTPDKPDPNALYPKPSSATQVTVSERFIEDGSYLRLKSLRLSYSLPTEALGVSSWLKSAQVYFSAINLLTITNYPGLDPDVNTRGTDSQNVGSRLIIGVDESGYPSSKTYAVGLKFGF